jgi:hypothetical protein
MDKIVIEWLNKMGKTEVDLKPYNQNLLSALLQGRDPIRSDAQLRDLFSDLGITAFRDGNPHEFLTSDDITKLSKKLFPDQNYLDKF